MVGGFPVDEDALGDPVGGDEGAVQAQVGQPGDVRSGEHVVQVWCVRGDHVQRLMQVAVGGGVTDAGVAGKGVQVRAVTQPPQHEQHLVVHGRGPLPRAGAWPAPMPGDPPGDRAENGCGHVETGTMRHQRAPGEEEIGLWRDDLHLASPRPLPEPRTRPAAT